MNSRSLDVLQSGNFVQTNLNFCHFVDIDFVFIIYSFNSALALFARMTIVQLMKIINKKTNDGI